MRDYLVKSTNVIIAIMNQQRKYTFRNTLNQFMKVELSHVHNVISKQNINKALKDTLQILAILIKFETEIFSREIYAT